MGLVRLVTVAHWLGLRRAEGDLGPGWAVGALEPAGYHVQNLVSPGMGFPAGESQVFHWF